MANEYTVESALAELQKVDENAYWRVVVTAYTMFVGYAPNLQREIKQSVDIVYTPWACGANDQRIFRDVALDAVMAQVKKWRESQS
jgi:hypothetical protein